MNTSSFSDRKSGRLVTTVEGAPAFAPNPIPRDLVLPAATQRRISEASMAVGRLAGIVARLVSPYLVASPLLRREAILSSRMEGTYTTPEDLVMMEASVKPPVPLQSNAADTREVANYIQAMKHGLTRLKSIPVSLRLIRELHGVLLREVRGSRERPGEFRTTQNWIGRPGDVIHEARFVPPPITEMARALDDFEKYLHEKTENTPPTLVRLALIHYQFETIHPFRDGNGRIGRLLMPLVLCAEGHMDDPTLYLSSYFESHRQQYVDLMLKVSQRGAWIEWINFFLDGVNACACESKDQAQGLLDLRDKYLERFRSARSSALLQTLIEELFRAPSVTIGHAAKLLGVSPATASANIEKLRSAGIVREITGRRRNQFFIAEEILACTVPPENPRPTGAEDDVTVTGS